MPIYEYECTACGTVTEVLTITGNTDTIPRCSACGSTFLNKKISVTTIPTHPSPTDGNRCSTCDETSCNASWCCAAQNR
ncbi:MAG: hypothetical protein N3B18_11895 [Desulfobacterota bacterium]|nr:hypothetical protein [Thermodesulfobacteriota bacterium]